MSKLPWKRTDNGDYVCGKYRIVRSPGQGARNIWTLYDEGRGVVECDRLGSAKRHAEGRGES